MYTVQMENECACFKKSEYTGEKSFNTQQDAYNYVNIVIELMNEEFCSTHLFFSQMISDNDFVIRVVQNPNAGSSCSTGSCSDDGWSLESTGSCDSGSCGC